MVLSTDRRPPLLTGGRDAVLEDLAAEPAAVKAGAFGSRTSSARSSTWLAVVTACTTAPRFQRVACAMTTRSASWTSTCGRPVRENRSAGRMGPWTSAKHELSQTDTRRRRKGRCGNSRRGKMPPRSTSSPQPQLAKDSDHQLRLVGDLASGRLAEPAGRRACWKPPSAIPTTRFAPRRFADFRAATSGRATSGRSTWRSKAASLDVGVLAVKALEAMAARDDQALARLTDALERLHLGRAQGGTRGARGGLPTRLAGRRAGRAGFEARRRPRRRPHALLRTQTTR